MKRGVQDRKILTERKPVQVATLSGLDPAEWRAIPDVAGRVHGYSLETVKNNLRMLSEEGAIEMRYGPRGRVEYRRPEPANG